LKIDMRPLLIAGSVILLSAALLAAPPTPPTPPTSQQRPTTPEDYFRLEELGSVAISPDGESVAYALKRSRASQPQKQDYLNGGDRSDIWLVPTRGGQPRNLTNGAADQAGYWEPAWSPDSERLAMLSTKGGNICLWIWDKRAGTLRQLTNRAIDPDHVHDLLWTSNTQLIVPVMPAGEKPLLMTADRQAAQTMVREWEKAWAGKETTANVLESGVPVALETRPREELLLVDAVAGSTKSLLTAPDFDQLTMASGSTTTVAMLTKRGVYQPQPDALLQHMKMELSDVTVVDGSRGVVQARPLGNLKDVERSTLRWAPDGTDLAVVARASDATDAPEVMFRCRISTNACQPVGADRLDLPQVWRRVWRPSVVWSSRHELLILSAAKGPGAAARPQWWIASENGDLHAVDATWKAAPTRLVREAGGRTFGGVADGHLWRVALDGSPARDLTPAADVKLTSIVWPADGQPEPDAPTHLIVGARNGDADDLYRVDLSSPTSLVALKKPVPGAVLAAYAPTRAVAVFTSSDRNGTGLWISHPAFETVTPILETNTFLREVAEGEFKPIQYPSLDGRALRGWILLPVGYKEGQRYPMITWVYAGRVYGDSVTPDLRVGFPNWLSQQQLAAHGFAVLLPSIPLGPDGGPGDPFLDIPKGVLPAVDKAIDLGIADPDRLGVMGQSFGGYTTYSLITQTTRFKAAVAMAGLVDEASTYGTFDPMFRYGSAPQESLFSLSLAESGQARMGNPPWKDQARYIRNSPISYVDRVQTPVMIIHGDMDIVPMEQAELFFVSLYRQNKRARFVRYWGEGHFISSMANNIDMWHRVCAWFDELLTPK
jgi:dipeptidyl aminopeptidase/acylaminoacyl peptidase